MGFEKEYFNAMKYANKERAVRRHVTEVIKWASETSSDDLMRGKGRKALDVGCAYGYSSKVLEMLGYDTYAVDISRWGISQGKSKSKGTFMVCDAQHSLPFEEDSFELVTCFDVLEHLRFPERALRNMFRVCRTAMICTTPNRLVEKPVRRITRDYDASHINTRSASEWKDRIAVLANLKLLKVETFLDVADKLYAKRFPRSVRFPYFGLTVRIIARK